MEVNRGDDKGPRGCSGGIENNLVSLKRKEKKRKGSGK